MNKDQTFLFKFELVSWLITALLLVAIIFPVFSNTPNYPFLVPNVVFVLTFLTFTRFIFLLRFTFLRYLQWAKVLSIVVCIPLVIYIVQELHAFEVFVDEVGVQSLFSHLPESTQSKLVEFTKTEMLLFGVGSVVCAIIFPVRMLISFWRTHNLGTT